MERQSNRERLNAPSFKDELETITSMPLTAENIDSYAGEALDRLVELIGKTTDEYDRRPTVSFATTREHEEAAFDYFGLDNVEVILDYIAEKADETHRIDSYIAAIESQDRVIMPPDESEPLDHTGEGELSEKRTVLRLKTLLFILTNEFGVDLADEGALSVVKGVNDPAMMRGESYYSVMLPSLNRHVLINDEVGNATYVLDSTRYEGNAMNYDTVLSLTKSELNNLLTVDGELGQRIVYGNNYTGQLINALYIPRTDMRAEKSQIVPAPSFLLPETLREGLQSTNALAAEFGLSRATVAKVAEQLTQEGEWTVSYGNSNRPTVLYDETQKARIYDELAARGMFLEAAPEGYESMGAMYTRLGMSKRMVVRAAESLGDELGEIERYKAGSKGSVTEMYSPAQITLITARLDELGYLQPTPPDGYVSAAMISRAHHLDRQVVDRILEEVSSDLGDLDVFRTQKAPNVPYLNPDQYALFKFVLSEKNLLHDQAPEGYLSANQIAENNDVSPDYIRSVVVTLGKDLGSITQFKHVTRFTDSFSPQQQMRIAEYVAAHRGNAAPEGYLPTKQVMKQLGVSYDVMNRLLDELAGELGDVARHRYGSLTVNSYSPEQQNVMRARVDTLKSMRAGKQREPVERAPEGYATRTDMARRFGRNITLIIRAVDELSDRLGDVSQYMHGSRLTDSYSPDQQSLVGGYITDAQHFKPAPEGYRTQNDLMKLLGVDHRLIKRAASDLELGELEQFKTNSTIRGHYSPEQVEALKGYFNS